MKTEVVKIIIKTAIILILISCYIFYNSLRFAYHYYYTLGDSNSDNIIWIEFIQPFIFAFILVMIIFILLGTKKNILIIAGIGFAFLLLYQPSVYSYKNTMLTFSENNLTLLNNMIEKLNKIDLFNILDTDYYKKEVSAVIICCIIIYLIKDIRVNYTLPYKKIVIIECTVCTLASIYLLFSFKFLPETKLITIIYISTIVICFFISKGLTKFILLSIGKDRTVLGLILMAIPWSLNMIANPYYNYSINESIFIIMILIIISTFTFICYTIELCNQSYKVEI